MLFIKKKIKICIFPGYEEERLIGYRFELVSEIIYKIGNSLWIHVEVESSGCAAFKPVEGSVELRCHLLVCQGLGTAIANATIQMSFCHTVLEIPVIITDITAGVCSFWGHVPQESLVNNCPFPFSSSMTSLWNAVLWFTASFFW